MSRDETVVKSAPDSGYADPDKNHRQWESADSLVLSLAAAKRAKIPRAKSVRELAGSTKVNWILQCNSLAHSRRPTGVHREVRSSIQL